MKLGRVARGQLRAEAKRRPEVLRAGRPKSRCVGQTPWDGGGGVQRSWPVFRGETATDRHLTPRHGARLHRRLTGGSACRTFHLPPEETEEQSQHHDQADFHASDRTRRRRVRREKPRREGVRMRTAAKFGSAGRWRDGRCWIRESAGGRRLADQGVPKKTRALGGVGAVDSLKFKRKGGFDVRFGGDLPGAVKLFG